MFEKSCLVALEIKIGFGRGREVLIIFRVRAEERTTGYGSAAAKRVRLNCDITEQSKYYNTITYDFGGRCAEDALNLLEGPRLEDGTAESETAFFARGVDLKNNVDEIIIDMNECKTDD